MTKTVQELLEQLKDVDECELVDLLSLTSEDIVNEFEDKIRDRQERILQFLGEDYDDQEEEAND